MVADTVADKHQFVFVVPPTDHPLPDRVASQPTCMLVSAWLFYIHLQGLYGRVSPTRTKVPSDAEEA